MAKLSDKNEQVIKILIEKGYFSKRAEVLNAALFEYFHTRELYEAVSNTEIKEKKK